MKAKIRKTGEIVEVYHETQHGTPKMIYKESVLVNSRIWTEDELELLTDNDEDEHWQDIRERAAIAAMQGLLCAPIIEGVNPNPSRESVAEWAVIQADALIEQLKKNNYGGKKKDRLEE